MTWTSPGLRPVIAVIAALKPPESPPWMLQLGRGPDDRPLAAQLEEVIGRFSEFYREVMPCLSALREKRAPAFKGR